MTQDEHIELLQMKDEELDGLKTEIMKEQQVNSHIQMVQVSWVGTGDLVRFLLN